MSRIIQAIAKPIYDISSFNFLLSPLWRAGRKDSFYEKFNRIVYLETENISASATFRHSWRLLKETGPTSTVTAKMTLYFEKMKVDEDIIFTNVSMNHLDYTIQIYQTNSVSGMFFLKNELRLNLFLQPEEKMVDNPFISLPDKTQRELKIIGENLEENIDQAYIIKDKSIF